MYRYQSKMTDLRPSKIRGTARLLGIRHYTISFLALYISGFCSVSTALTKPATFAWVRPVYIRSTGAFFPNDPVPNHEIDQHIGKIHSERSGSIRDKVLSSNGITNRYYAMKNNRPTHLNADLAALAAHDALRQSEGVTLDQVGMLATGTTAPDVLVPGFANLVHGRLGAKKSMDCLSSAGVCISSVSALKAAANSVTLGEHQRALVVGSETASHGLSSNCFKGFDTEDEDILDPKDAFKAEFLRYMLSDGAGCALVDQEPHPSKLSFRIERFYHHSFAHALPPCMVMGNVKPGISIKVEETYKFNDDQPLLLQQDTYLLHKQIIRRFKESLSFALEQGFLGDKKRVDWFIPHISSYLFFDQVAGVVQELLGVPRERIWTNLSSVGNVGAASTMLLLWGLLSSDDSPDIKKGDRVLVMVPESGNFSYQYLLLTVVDPSG